MPGTSRFSILLRCARLTVLLCRATFRASSRMARPTSSPTRRRLSTALSSSGSAASAVSWLRTSPWTDDDLEAGADLSFPFAQDHLPPSRLPSLHSWLVDHQYALHHPFELEETTLISSLHSRRSVGDLPHPRRSLVLLQAPERQGRPRRNCHRGQPVVPLHYLIVSLPVPAVLLFCCQRSSVEGSGCKVVLSGLSR